MHLSGCISGKIGYHVCHHKLPAPGDRPCPDAPTAFFSYSRDDSEFALRLAEDLKAAGAGVWIDQLDIQPGQRWARAMVERSTAL